MSPPTAPAWTEFRRVFATGLWTQNAGLVQLLGLCPLLAISNTAINGISLGLATALVMAMSNAAVSAVRHLVPNEIRIPVFVLVIAVLVTVVELLMHAYLHGLYQVLGIFVPLIVTNCIVLARTEAFAAKHPVLPSIADGLGMGCGLTAVLAVLGASRELIGSGLLFTGIEHFVPGAVPLRVAPEAYPGILLALLPSGAFLGLGCLIAAKNWLDTRAQSGAAAASAAKAAADLSA